jgi:two-component system, NtrC family, response regulator HydG
MSVTGSLLALAPPGALEPSLRSGEVAGLALEVTPRLSTFLERLRAGDWGATLVSLSADSVDERVVERIAREPGGGALFLSTPLPSLEWAVLVHRLGAAAVLREPVQREELEGRLAPLMAEGAEVNVPSPGDATPRDDAPTLIGSGPAFTRLFEMMAKVAPTDATVLVTGESGTGKEVVARALHRASRRRDAPFIPVNCAAIPENLLESELFGHEKGAFTGAVAYRKGRFERSHGGTLFLDEIGDLSLVLQAKLLRALEERVIEPVGSEAPRPVDVRIIAATNRDLTAAVREREFREDLYYRLAVVALELPPLRDRPEDVVPLALHFAARFAGSHGRPVRAITEGALRRLVGYPWPGNVRELRNVMDRAVVLAGGPVLRSAHLRLGEAAPRTSARTEPQNGGGGYPPSLSLAEVEADHIRRVLDAGGGHIGRAADVLGIHRNTLARKLREYGIEAPGAGTEGGA